MDDDATYAALRVGRTLCGKYRLDALIGVGGMAAVYKGVHRNGNRVAVKVLHPTISVIKEIRERFLREGYVANTVDHPGVVRVLDDDAAEDGSVFLVMELLEGQTLREMWERAGQTLPLETVAGLMHQLLDVLAAAHARGIVHRDIKPDNLFVMSTGQLKVLDFGIARLRDSAGSAHTRTGGILGTPGFMPREQVLGLTREIDARTDLWSVGATAFTLLTGRRVHDGETPEQVVVLTATQPVQPLSAVAPGVPSAIAAVIDRALAFNREDRFQDARSMEEALDRAFESSFGAALRPQGIVPPPRETTLTAARLGPSPMGQPLPASTTGGVAAGSQASAATAIGSSQKALVIGGIAAVVLTLTAGTAAWLHKGSDAHGQGTAQPPPPTATATEAPTVNARSPVPEPPEATPQGTAAAPTTPPHDAAHADVPARPPAPALNRTNTPTRPPAAPPVAPAHPPVAPSAPSSAVLNCDPPWYLDPVTHGRKVKPGC